MTQSLFSAEFGMFTYKVVDDSVTITGYPDSAKGKVVIPSVIDGKTVTVIGKGAFTYCEGLTSITIPNGVTKIGNSAFGSCAGLASITIPNSVTRIQKHTFSGCTGLTSVTIPNGITHIGFSAFSRCFGLTGVDIPDSVTSIGYYAFFGCNGLASFTIPKSVKRIGRYAFSGCSKLVSFQVDSDNPTYSSKGGILFDKEQTLLIACSPGLKGGYVIPDDVTGIRRYAFEECAGLTSVTIPGSVTSIGEYAFSGCSGLASVIIPGSVMKIGEYAFMNCASLTSVTIPDSVTRIGSGAFFACYWLTDITIPDSITSIGDYVFYRCSGLTQVTIPDSVTRIGLHAFSGCTALTKVTIPGSVTKIRNRAFFGCSGLKKATFLGNAPQLGNKGNSVFRKTSDQFKVYFHKGKTGFTSPTWNGYPTVELDDAPKIDGESLDGGNLNNVLLAGISGNYPLNWDAPARSCMMDAAARPAKVTTGIAVIDGQKYRMLVVKHPPAKTLLIEVSGNLVDWYSGARYTTLISDSDSVLKMRDNTPLVPGTKRFIRARAMAP